MIALIKKGMNANILQEGYENGLKRVENKHSKETSLRKTTTTLVPILGTNINIFVTRGMSLFFKA